MCYRPNVAAIVVDRQDRILVCERNDYPGSWQFPQGGVKNGENLDHALWRELKEEISLQPADVQLLEKRGGYRYRFPKGLKKKRWIGQEQTYFLLRLVREKSAVNVATASPEFKDVQWIHPADFQLRWLPPEKHPVYRQVLRDFFQVDVAIPGNIG